MRVTPCHQVAKDDGGGHGSSEPDHHTALGCKWNRVERYGALSHAQPSLRGLRSSQPCTLRPESSRRSSERAIGSYFKGCVGWKCCRGNFRPSACLQASARFYGSHHPDLTTSLDFPPCRVWHTSAIFFQTFSLHLLHCPVQQRHLGDVSSTDYRRASTAV